jgi:hypothetical protein
MGTEWLNIVISILSGIAAVIPLVIKLVEYVKKSIKEKNWNEIVKIALDYMKTAETKFTDGATRKEWVIAMVKTSAKGVDYDLDDTAIAKLSDMIDKICDAAKVINTTIEDKEAEEAGA